MCGDCKEKEMVKEEEMCTCEECKCYGPKRKCKETCHCEKCDCGSCTCE